MIRCARRSRRVTIYDLLSLTPPGFLTRNPSPTLVASLAAQSQFADLSVYDGFGPPVTLSDVTAISDDRFANLAATTVQGIDVSAQLQLHCGSWRCSASAAGTFLTKFSDIPVPGQPAISRLNRLGEPAGTRITSAFTLENNRFSSTLTGNYIGSYKNDTTTPTSRVSSWFIQLVRPPSSAICGNSLEVTRPVTLSVIIWRLFPEASRVRNRTGRFFLRATQPKQSRAWNT